MPTQQEPAGEAAQPTPEPAAAQQEPTAQSAQPEPELAWRQAETSNSAGITAWWCNLWQSRDARCSGAGKRPTGRQSGCTSSSGGATRRWLGRAAYTACQQTRYDWVSDRALVRGGENCSNASRVPVVPQEHPTCWRRPIDLARRTWRNLHCVVCLGSACSSQQHCETTLVQRGSRAAHPRRSKARSRCCLIGLLRSQLPAALSNLALWCTWRTWRCTTAIPGCTFMAI